MSASLPLASFALPSAGWLVSAPAITIGTLDVPAQWAVLLLCGVAGGGLWNATGWRQLAGVLPSLLVMLFAGLLAARIAFVAVWFEQYRCAPWSVCGIRDGGFLTWVRLFAVRQGRGESGLCARL